jgi:hypothetical protein
MPIFSRRMNDWNKRKHKTVVLSLGDRDQLMEDLLL